MANLVTDEERKFWQQNPVLWIKEFLGANLWSKQQEIIEAIRDHNKVAVRSGNGVGKSFVAACIVLWHLFVHRESKIVTTAPGMGTVKQVLWSEIAKLHKKLEERVENVGHLTQAQLTLSAGWYAVGKTTDDPQRFLGTHERNLLVIFDEASGVPREIYTAAGALLTARGNKQLLIGNPWVPGTVFHECFTGERPGYHKIHINVLESPNIKKVIKNGKITYEDNLDENGELVYPDLSSLDWVNEIRDAHGERSMEWTVQVLGEFPTIATDALIDGRWLAAAVQKGIFLRETIKRLDEGSEIYDAETIRRLTGRNV